MPPQQSLQQNLMRVLFPFHSDLAAFQLPIHQGLRTKHISSVTKLRSLLQIKAHVIFVC